MSLHDNVLPEIVNDIGAFRLDFGIYDQGKCIDSCKSAPVDITYDNQLNILQCINWSARIAQLHFKNNLYSYRKTRFTNICNLPVHARLAVILVVISHDKKDEKIGYGVISLFDFNCSFVQGRKVLKIYRWDNFGQTCLMQAKPPTMVIIVAAPITSYQRTAVNIWQVHAITVTVRVKMVVQ